MSIVPRSPIASAAATAALMSPFMNSANVLPLGLGTPGSAPSGSGPGNGTNGWSSNAPTTPTNNFSYAANGGGLGMSVGAGNTRSSSVHSSPILRPVHRLPMHAAAGAREREERGRTLRQVNDAAAEGVKRIALAGLTTGDDPVGMGRGRRDGSVGVSTKGGGSGPSSGGEGSRSMSEDASASPSDMSLSAESTGAPQSISRPVANEDPSSAKTPVKRTI